MLTDSLPADSFNTAGPPQAPPSLRERLNALPPHAGLKERLQPTRPPSMTPEKLNETLTLKLCDTSMRQFRGFAEHAGVTPSELARHIIEQYLEKERERFRSLHSIFGND